MGNNNVKNKSMNSNSQINLNSNIDISLDKCKLYLNVVGGYSLFIEISDNYLIKSASENEIAFYESSYQKSTHLYSFIQRKNPSQFSSFQSDCLFCSSM